MKLQEIKSQIREAMLTRDAVKRDILRLVLGQVQNSGDESDESVCAAIKKIVKSNTETINNIRETYPDKLSDITVLEQENNVISWFLPRSMSLDEIKAFIAGVDLSASKNEGQSMGIVVKALKAADKIFEPKDVKLALASA